MGGKTALRPEPMTVTPGKQNPQNNPNMRKIFRQVLPIQLLMLAFTFVIFPSNASSQTITPSKTRDTLNIGFVLYTRSGTPGTLFARWNYANIWSGPGIATGGPREGFAGNYHVRYFFENGDFSDEYDLVIEKTGDFYNVSWITKGKVRARGVGMEVDHGLAVGWRQVTE
jgi:hypothetical protein